MGKQGTAVLWAIGIAVAVYYLYQNGTVNAITGGQYGPPAPVGVPGEQTGDKGSVGGGAQYGPPAPTNNGTPSNVAQVLLFPLIPGMPSRTCTLTFGKDSNSSAGKTAKADCILTPGDADSIFNAFPNLQSIVDWLGITHTR